MRQLMKVVEDGKHDVAPRRVNYLSQNVEKDEEEQEE